MSINIRLLKQTIAEQGGKKIASRANQAIKLNFNTQKEELLRAFDNHEVTQEIEGGPHTQSSQPELKAQDGNLYSLIGFNQGQDPIGGLRKILESRITVDTNNKRVSVKSDGRLEVAAPVSIPTLDEIYEATANSPKTQVPWNKGRSFVQMIQRGVSGFGHYIAGMFDSPEPSRSGGGVQAKNKVRDTDLGPIPYVNELLATFKRSLSRKK